MTKILQLFLILHVIFGLVGAISNYATLLYSLKRTMMYKQVKIWSMLGAFSYLLAWLTGGYYYSKYYGESVKPVIKNGDYEWGHSFFMEAKEHIFLLLPFLSFVIALAFWSLAAELNPPPSQDGTPASSSSLKWPLILLTILTFSLGVLMALSGILISGAVR